MNLQELNLQEMCCINGGGTENFGNSSVSISGSADALFSINFTWQRGDRYESRTIEIGKDVHFNLGNNFTGNQ